MMLNMMSQSKLYLFISTNMSSLISLLNYFFPFSLYLVQSLFIVTLEYLLKIKLKVNICLKVLFDVNILVLRYNPRFVMFAYLMSN